MVIILLAFLYQYWKRPDRIAGTDCIYNKRKLSLNLKGSGDIPATYLLPEQYDELQDGKWYIYKTQSHRQEGLHVARGRLPLHIIQAEQFVLAQDFVVNTLQFRGRKVTMRLYCIVRNNKHGLSTWVSSDGMVYYSREPYDLKSPSICAKIASFYDSTELYRQGYPVTIREFGQPVDRMQQLVRTCLAPVLKRQRERGGLGYGKQLFGIDFHLMPDGQPLIIEVNSGPGMKAYDERDREMRAKVLNKLSTPFPFPK